MVKKRIVILVWDCDIVRNAGLHELDLCRVLLHAFVIIRQTIDDCFPQQGAELNHVTKIYAFIRFRHDFCTACSVDDVNIAHHAAHLAIDAVYDLAARGVIHTAVLCKMREIRHCAVNCAGKFIASTDKPEQHILRLDVVIDALGLVGKFLDTGTPCKALL